MIWGEVNIGGGRYEEVDTEKEEDKMKTQQKTTWSKIRVGEIFADNEIIDGEKFWGINIKTGDNHTRTLSLSCKSLSEIYVRFNKICLYDNLYKLPKSVQRLYGEEIK